MMLVSFLFKSSFYGTFYLVENCPWYRELVVTTSVVILSRFLIGVEERCNLLLQK